MENTNECFKVQFKMFPLKTIQTNVINEPLHHEQDMT